jgi:hypothetical protein
LQALPQPLTAEEAPPQTPSQPLALTELQYALPRPLGAEVPPQAPPQPMS